MKRLRRAVLIACLAAGGCSAPGIQSALDPAADQSAAIHGIWILMLAVCGVMYALVVGFLAWALLRHRRRRDASPAAPETETQDPGLQTATAIWTGVIVAGILGLSAASFLVDRSLAQSGPAPLKIKVTAKQWWWAVEYQDPDNPSRTLTTANELHLPQGRSAHIELQAQDVIHSLWVPNLHGKEDLIPGRTNHIVITPRRIGVFRGQCAEFCGLQHAHMALDVTVETPERFNAWYDAKLAPAPEPATASQLLGRQVFLGKACALCHQISGTTAASRAGPDLTHVASRKSLAAGTLPYSQGDLAAWINDPQSFKPGANMPAVPMSGEELSQLVDYLDSLK
jgi:cytochrome c oxidase subunit 2